MLDHLYALFSNEEALVQKFIQLLKSELPGQLQELQAQAHAAQWDKVSLTAHSLKGQIGYLGLPELDKLALQIEHMAEDSPGPEIMHLINRFHKNCETVLQNLP